MDVSARRRLRAVIKASITKSATRVNELEMKPELSRSDELAAKRMQERLTGLDGEFKGYHFAGVALLEEDEDLDREQAVLDEHDDRVTGLFNRITGLITPVRREIKAYPKQHISKRLQHISKRLQHLERNLRKVATDVSTAADKREVDRCLLEQYDEQINRFKVELFDTLRSIISLDGDATEVTEQETKLSQVILDTRLRIHRVLQSPPPPVHGEGIKLLKIDVPKFDGEIMNWKGFWEQYEMITLRQ